MKPVQARVAFQTSGTAKVTQVYVCDGGDPKYNESNLSITHPVMTPYIAPLGDGVMVQEAMVITIRVSFDTTTANDWIRVGWAGIKFDTV